MELGGLQQITRNAKVQSNFSGEKKQHILDNQIMIFYILKIIQLMQSWL